MESLSTVEMLSLFRRWCDEDGRETDGEDGEEDVGILFSAAEACCRRYTGYALKTRSCQDFLLFQLGLHGGTER